MDILLSHMQRDIWYLPITLKMRNYNIKLITDLEMTPWHILKVLNFHLHCCFKDQDMILCLFLVIQLQKCQPLFHVDEPKIRLRLQNSF